MTGQSVAIPSQLRLSLMECTQHRTAANPNQSRSELAGLGSIERSTKNGVPSYTNADTFVLNLDGSSHELAYLPSTGFYQTRIDTYLRIKFDARGDSDASNDYWLVTSRSGIRYRSGYVNSLVSGSRVPKIDDTSKTSKWLLDRTTDTHGNYVDISYELFLIRTNPNYLDKTQFYRGGVPIESPFQVKMVM